MRLYQRLAASSAYPHTMRHGAPALVAEAPTIGVAAESTRSRAAWCDDPSGIDKEA